MRRRTFPPALPRLQVSRSSQDLVNMLLLLIDYAQDERIEVPPAILDAAAADQNPSEPTQDWQRQSEALNKLAELIAPARPQTVAMLQQEKWKRQLARRPGFRESICPTLVRPWASPAHPVSSAYCIAIPRRIYRAAGSHIPGRRSPLAPTRPPRCSERRLSRLSSQLAADAGSNFGNWGTAAALVCGRWPWRHFRGAFSGDAGCRVQDIRSYRRWSVCSSRDSGSSGWCLTRSGTANGSRPQSHPLQGSPSSVASGHLSSIGFWLDWLKPWRA